MIGIAVVASAHDAKFAEEVRAGLQAAGFDASVSQSLPKAASPRVVLIWSAALEAGHAIDAQALIALWSEDRLVIARRDETPLPLGLRDLPSLPPNSSAAEVCGAVPGARHLAAGSISDVDQVSVGSMAEFGAPMRTGATGSQEVELEFWRAIKDGNDPDDFELYVHQFPTGVYVALAKRKIEKLRGTATEDPNAAELEKRDLEEAGKREAGRKTIAETPKAKKLAGPIIAAIIAIILVGGGSWYYVNKSSIEKQAALTAALETATKASQELQQAQAKQLESLKALEQARAAEDAARKSGDVAKLKEALEATKRGEAEAAKQAEAVKQREVAAADARKKATEAAESAKKASKMSEPLAKAPEPVAKAAEAPKAKTRSEREREEEDRLARQSALKQSVPVATESPSLTATPDVASSSAAATATATPALDFDVLYQQAAVMEQEGKAAESVRIYRRAARAGSGKAAKRLGEIYDKGVPGISRDYAESLQWYETARQLGEHVESAKTRGGSEAPVVVAPSPAPEPAAVAKSEPISVRSAPVIQETAKSEPAKAAAVKSAPKTREPAKPDPVPAAKVVPAPEPVKAEAPAPAPAPVLEPAKVTPPAPAPERKTEWFSLRGLLIALLVLGLIAWRRVRRREKAAARQAQRQPDATMAAARSVYKPSTAAPQGDATLFVSYSHKDRSRVEPIVSVIEEMGRRVWMDRTDITGQTGWAGQIVRAIRECRAVVLMASPNSYTSDQVVRELYLAMNHRKTIVPIEIEPAELPDELQYILAPFQHHRLSAGETRAVLGRALAAV